MLAPSAAQAKSGAGALDPSFGASGKVVTGFRLEGKRTSDVITDIVLQTNGKIVAIGWAGAVDGENPFGYRGARFALARYRRNGSLDPRFGEGGRVAAAFAARKDLNAFGRSVAVEQDGKILVAGDVHGDPGWSAFAVARYTRDGVLDPTFGAGGIATTVVGSGLASFATGVAAQTDGKIVVGGWTYSEDGPQFELVRYKPDGLRDRSFGVDGFASGPGGWASDIALQPDGKTVIAGSGTVARYRPDGSLDPSFGQFGVTSPPSRFDTRALVLQVDGKIVIAGDVDRVGAIARLNADGSIDTGFGTGGVVKTKVDYQNWANAVALEASQKIVAAMFSSGDGIPAEYFVLARYTPEGALDRSFGSLGIVTTARSEGSVPYAVAVQPDGRIVAGGLSTKTDYENFDFTLVRLLGGARCIVPRLLGQRLPRAKRAIRHRNCSVGKITRKYSSRIGSGRVAAQGPRPNALRRAGYRVRLVVSKGRRPS